ncbi:MAG TPA: hypothetical protein VL860_12505, partial [Planctomycetota bacterium]|nr:hypothetical protein [Planctomycetota bacterium]
AGSFYRVKITDLGLGQTRLMGEEDKENRGWAQGTPNYIAPEQVLGDPAQDFRVDIYSLGLTAYRMLVGRTPFEGRATTEIRQAHLNMVVPSPFDLLPDEIPIDLCRVLENMTAKLPKNRYANYSDLIADLNAVRSNSPIQRSSLDVGLATVAPPQTSPQRTSGTLPRAQPIASSTRMDSLSPDPSPENDAPQAGPSGKRRPNIRRFRRHR